MTLRGSLIALDTETTGKRSWHGDRPFAFSFCDEHGTMAYAAGRVDPFSRAVTLEPDLWEKVAAVCADASLTKIFHHRKFDREMLRRIAVPVHGVTHDTMFAAHTCDSAAPNYKLKRLAKVILDIEDEDEKELDKAVLWVRNRAKKKGWKLAFDEKEDKWGVLKKKAATKADMWMPREYALRYPAEAREYFNTRGVDLLTVCETYAKRDAYRTMGLHLFYRDLMPEMEVQHIYEMEQELADVIDAAEIRGVAVDPERLARVTKQAKEDADKHYREMVAIAGEEINPDAPEDLRRILFGKLGLTATVFTDKEKLPAVNIEALQAYMREPFVNHLLQFRSSAKAYSSFFSNFKKALTPDPRVKGGVCIHCDFQQVGPITGRLACRNPNLQNVASAGTTRSLMPIQGRTPFVPRPGYVWLHADYAQLEVRIFADVSQDQFLLDTIARGEDLHTACANKAWGGEGNPAAVRQAIEAIDLYRDTPHNEKIQALWDEYGWTKGGWNRPGEAEALVRDWLDRFGWDIVAAEESVEKKLARAKAKMILFGKIYGGGAGAIQSLIQSTLAEAKQFMKDYDTALPGLQTYSRDLVRQARMEGGVRTVYGRWIPVDPEFAYRCVNYKVQGSAADLIKFKMVDAARWLRDSGLPAITVLTIHDELVFEVRRDALLTVARGIKPVMEDVKGVFNLPLPTEHKITTVSWEKQEKFDAFKEAA